MSIRETILKLKEELPSGVELVAVSKFHPADAVRAAYAAGQRVFAESRPQELHAKAKELAADTAADGTPLYPDIEWHFIGHLQTNKLKLVLPYVAMVQSVDSLHLLEAIDRWGQENDRVTDVLLECHIAAEQTKQGFSGDEVKRILFGEQSFPNVRFRGLMGMATFTDDEAVIRKDFGKIRDLFDAVRGRVGSDAALNPCAPACGMNGSGARSPFSPDRRLKDFTELSIGMSGDYRIALEYGSTMVRIGTMIFGPR